MSHADNDTRQAFEDAVYHGTLLERYDMAGKLWNCTDVMPASLCADLGLPDGKTYASAARLVRLGYHPNMTKQEFLEYAVIVYQRWFEDMTRLGLLQDWRRDADGFRVELSGWAAVSYGRGGALHDMVAEVLGRVERTNGILAALSEAAR